MTLPRRLLLASAAALVAIRTPLSPSRATRIKEASGVHHQAATGDDDDAAGPAYARRPPPPAPRPTRRSARWTLRREWAVIVDFNTGTTLLDKSGGCRDAAHPR